MDSVAAAAAARLIEYDAERLCASGKEAADQYAALDCVDSGRVPAIFLEEHAWILAFETFVPFITRMNDATHLHFPEQLIKRCAQLI